MIWITRVSRPEVVLLVWIKIYCGFPPPKSNKILDAFDTLIHASWANNVQMSNKRDNTQVST